MDEERRSVTAEGAAVMRALHQKLDGEPKIRDDLISARLVEPDSYTPRLELLKRLPAGTALRLKAGFVLSSRFAEDCGSESVSESVHQFSCPVKRWVPAECSGTRSPGWRRDLVETAIVPGRTNCPLGETAESGWGTRGAPRPTRRGTPSTPI
jgi:hypothetical protein